MSLEELRPIVNQLLLEVQSASQVQEHEALAIRINALKGQVMGLGEDGDAVKRRFEIVAQLNTLKAQGKAPPIPHDVATYLGTVNQFEEGRGPNSSCTCCAQCFLARTLPRGTACSIQSDEIDDIVRDGYDVFALLLKNKKAEALTAGIPDDIPIAEAVSSASCNETYGLHILNAGGDKEKRVLVKGEDGTTKGFFRQLLQEFENGIGKRNALGGVIHSQGKTYSLALFQSARGFEWALFDSHGNLDWNKHTAAYVKHTDSLEKMVDCLSELIEYKSSGALIMDIPKEQRALMEADDNEFILYVVEHQDHVLLAQPYVIPEPKIVDPKVLVDTESTNIERQIALFLLIIAALGVSYRLYLNRQIPHEVVVIPAKA